MVTILRWVLDHYVVPSKIIIEHAITDFYLENPNEKDLKAVMTSKGHITIKSAKKAEKTAQKAETAKETD